MLQCLFRGVFLKILAIEFGAVTEEVFLKAKRLLIGSDQDDDEDGMRLACQVRQYLIDGARYVIR